MAMTFARPSAACWCGYIASEGRVSITTVMPNADSCPPGWPPAVIHEHADALALLDAALPAGLALEAFGGHAEVTTRDRRKKPVAAFDFVGFDALAKKLGTLGRAVRRPPPPGRRVWTVQLFAGASEARAEALRARVDASRSATSGFFVAGDFPANNPVARVLFEKNARGRALYKVVMGAFLRPEEARRAAEALRAELGGEAFVRPI